MCAVMMRETSTTRLFSTFSKSYMFGKNRDVGIDMIGATSPVCGRPVGTQVRATSMLYICSS